MATPSKSEKKNRLRKGDLQTSATPRNIRSLTRNEQVSGSSPLVGSLDFRLDELIIGKRSSTHFTLNSPLTAL